MVIRRERPETHLWRTSKSVVRNAVKHVVDVVKLGRWQRCLLCWCLSAPSAPHLLMWAFFWLILLSDPSRSFLYVQYYHSVILSEQRGSVHYSSTCWRRFYFYSLSIVRAFFPPSYDLSHDYQSFFPYLSLFCGNTFLIKVQVFPMLPGNNVCTCYTV